MPKERCRFRRRSVRLGPSEWNEARKLAKDFQVSDVEHGARLGMMIACALNNARRAGLSMHLIGTNGRWYSYELCTPKVAHELDRRGMRTGKTIDLVDFVPCELPSPSWLGLVK